MQNKATNLKVEQYKNIGEGNGVAPSLNFMFVPSSRNNHAVANCCGYFVESGFFGLFE